MAGAQPPGLDVDLPSVGSHVADRRLEVDVPARVFTQTSSEPPPTTTMFFFIGRVIQPRPVPFGICRQWYVGWALQMPLLEPE